MEPDSDPSETVKAIPIKPTTEPEAAVGKQNPEKQSDKSVNIKADGCPSGAESLSRSSSPSTSRTSTSAFDRLPKPKEHRVTLAQLSDHLHNQLQSEEQYKLINDAKLRAMQQGTASYEEFRQIWMAAHLRPVEKGDRLEGGGGRSKVVWNSVASSKKNDN